MGENGEGKMGINRKNGGGRGKIGGNGEKQCVCISVCCLPVPMEHLATYQGIKYVPMKVITDPARKWVTSMWYPKLLTGAIKMETMTKKKASDVGVRGTDADGRPFGRRLGDFLVLVDALLLPPSGPQSPLLVFLACGSPPNQLPPSQEPFVQAEIFLIIPFPPIFPHFPSFFQFRHFSTGHITAHHRAHHHKSGRARASLASPPPPHPPPQVRGRPTEGDFFF